MDVIGRPAEVHHADVVNVYHARATINNYGAAIEGDSSWELDAD